MKKNFTGGDIAEKGKSDIAHLLHKQDDGSKKYINGKTYRKKEFVPEYDGEQPSEKKSGKLQTAFEKLHISNAKELVSKAVSLTGIVLCVCIAFYIGTSGVSSVNKPEQSTAATSKNSFGTDSGNQNDTSAANNVTIHSAANVNSKDAISVINLSTGAVEKDDSALIVAQVLEAEMGSSYSDEALKAQAVAIYSFLIYHGANSGSTPTVAMSAASDKCIYAAEAVKNKSMNYNGRPIEALWCDVSAGKTADNKDVWGNEVAYLKSVDSSVDLKATNFQTTHTYKSSDVAKWLKDEFKIDIAEQKDKNRWFACSYDSKTGLYVTNVNLGSQKTVSGMSLRYNLFSESRVGKNNSLESHAFTVSYDNKSDSFKFTVKGIGNGIGMSKNGADALAKMGWTYDKILAHYYTDIVIK